MLHHQVNLVHLANNPTLVITADKDTLLLKQGRWVFIRQNPRRPATDCRAQVLLLLLLLLPTARLDRHLQLFCELPPQSSETLPLLM